MLLEHYDLSIVYTASDPLEAAKKIEPINTFSFFDTKNVPGFGTFNIRVKVKPSSVRIQKKICPDVSFGFFLTRGSNLFMEDGGQQMSVAKMFQGYSSAAPFFIEKKVLLLNPSSSSPSSLQSDSRWGSCSPPLRPAAATAKILPAATWTIFS